MFKSTELLILIIYILLSSIYLYSDSENNDNNMKLQTIKKITPSEANELIRKYKFNPDLIILDVRTPEEFGEEHIENAKNLDFYSKSFKQNLKEFDKDKTYIIHCRSGARSSKTLIIMQDLGFNEVFDMGGIIQWKKQGFETVK